MNDNRRKLYNYLNSNKDKVSSDPFYHTKTFLNTYHIPEREFFNWIIEEGKQYNFNVESDISVMKAMI